MASIRLGVDIGGTFTDIVALRSDGALFSKKVLSTPDDYSRGIEDGLRSLFTETGIKASEVVEFAHGTTVATNTIIERKGARAALLTTKGFRDVLELGRFRSPRLYDLNFRKPPPLVRRELRFEVAERIGGQGEVIEPIDLDALSVVAVRLSDLQIEAVAICFLNAYVNPEHEIAAERHLRAHLSASVTISTSGQLLPQIQEYERTSTMVINAYLRPIIEKYVQSLEDRLRRLGITAPLMIMQSSGGILPGRLAGENPVYIIESGPAAGVVGSQRLSAAHGLGDLMVLDVGGTTAKASIIENGQFAIMPECEVGGDALLGHRLMPGAGYPVQVPTIDIAEVGAGGGSIASATNAGGLQVGPHSAGAFPGPACYGRGGEQATLTDANLVLGYLSRDRLVGGEMALNAARAETVLADLGRRVSLSVTDVAYGIHRIGNATMMRALSSVSSERGQDPARFTLLAMGGNGAVHAGDLAETLGLSRIVVPPAAGLFSALGLLSADVEHQLVRAFYRPLATVRADEINDALRPMIEEVSSRLSASGFATAGSRRIDILLEVKYAGQDSTIGLALPGFPADPAMIPAIAAAFDEEHLRQYGYSSPGEQKRAVAIKVVGRGLADHPRLPDRISRIRDDRLQPSRREVYYGPEYGWLNTPVRAREDLGAEPDEGPMIVEEYDTTAVVRPGWTARRDGGNNIVLERRGAEAGAPKLAAGALTPVRRELFQNALVTVADNMIVTVVRTSRSEVVKSSLDFSSAICDAEGQIIAQGLALPAHLGSMMPALKGCLDRLGADLRPGDIMASNDPYAGASHLNDIYMFKPVFSAGERVAFLCLVVHHTDMGGRVPGGNATDSSEIFQEGLRIPPSKIFVAGTPNTTLLNIIEANVRVPDKVMGDLRAQLASLNLAEAEMAKLLTEYDTASFKALAADLIDYTEKLTRATIRDLPDGVAEFTDWIDDDGVGSAPVKIHARLTVAGDRVEVDFSGTSPQTTGAINPNFWFTASCTYAAIRSVIDPSVPNNAGLYRAISVTAPEGCFVNPRFPAPVGARGLAGYRIRHVVSGALAMLMPERMPACPGGNEFGIVFAGRHADNRPFLFLEFHNTTGVGGYPERDGEDAGPWCLTNVANVPVEVIEAENPIRVEEYALLPDTGGPGRHRGGLGIVRQYRLLADEATVQLRSDRQRHAPWGLARGLPGARSRSLLNPGPGETVLPSKFLLTMRKGDVFRAEMPGSGGHGPASERDPEAVADDVRSGKVSVQHARSAYGIVMDPAGLAVDAAATRRLRAEQIEALHDAEAQLRRQSQ
ncbi:MAG: hydantoinase B/oxoprolinase family protein [Pseudomonadota bacterium]|nr:hydantoinase B/oxoprolinase family protein [Pseudomonadota bacterium]